MEALRAFGEEHGRDSVVAHWLRQDILRRNAQDERSNQSEAEQQTSDGQDATMAATDATGTEGAEVDPDGSHEHGEADGDLAAAA